MRVYSLLAVWMVFQGLAPANVGHLDDYEALRKVWDRKNTDALSLIERGKYPEAVAALEALKVEVSSEPSSGELNLVQARYVYNLGVALERSGKNREALTEFETTLRLDSGLAVASDGIFRLFGSGNEQCSSPDMSEILTRPPLAEPPEYTLKILFGTLLRDGALDRSAVYFRRALREGKMSPEMTSWFAKFLAKAAIPPDDFANTWDLDLTVAQMNETCALSRERLAAIQSAYKGEIPANMASIARFSEAWHSVLVRKEWSEFLEVLGRLFAKEGKLTKSFAAYLLALRDTLDPRAATYVASLLQKYPTVLDPFGRNLDALVSTLLEVTGSDDTIEWTGRCHIVLAEIFDKQGKWGGETEPRSSIYQWSKALQAASRSKNGSAELPALHAHLALAYQEIGHRDISITEYLAGVRGYLSQKRPEAAGALLNLVKNQEQLPSYLDPKLRTLIAVTGESITAAEKYQTGSGEPDSDLADRIREALGADPRFSDDDLGEVGVTEGHAIVELQQGSALRERVINAVSAVSGVRAVEVRMVDLSPPQAVR